MPHTIDPYVELSERYDDDLNRDVIDIEVGGTTVLTITHPQAEELADKLRNLTEARATVPHPARD